MEVNDKKTMEDKRNNRTLRTLIYWEACEVGYGAFLDGRCRFCHDFTRKKEDIM